MNKWTNLSIEYANQRSYLDDLFQVYPTIPEGIREINENVWAEVEKAFKRKNNGLLIRELLKLDLFPIKDSYIAYLKRDSSSIDRNPRTINRICGRIYEIGLDKLYERCSEPKETNRQIGPMFREWLRKKSLGITPVELSKFLANKKDAILDGSDKSMMDFAKEELGYNHNKGLDFVGRFNGKYVIGAGIWELMICLAIMLILFGNRLPSVMRSLGSSAREFKKGAEGITDDLEEATKASPSEPASKSLPE